MRGFKFARLKSWMNIYSAYMEAPKTAGTQAQRSLIHLQTKFGGQRTHYEGTFGDAFWRGGTPLLVALAASGGVSTALCFEWRTKPAKAEASASATAAASPPALPPAGPPVAIPLVNPVEKGGPGGKQKKRIVILGTGWGAIGLLKGLNTDNYEVVIVSPRNYFLFTPLLPGVTSGSVEGRSISEPIRRILQSRHKEAHYWEAECTDIDPVAHTVKCRDVGDIRPVEGCDFELAYDYLVVAVGAEPNTFNTPGVAEHCHFLKEINDADRIREHIVDCYESASLPSVSVEEKRRLLRFVIVGGGPTGVEFAAELHDLVRDDLCKLYPELTGLATISVVQSADHILNTFDKRISDFAKSKFSRDGVTVRTGCRVLEVTAHDVLVQDRAVEGTVRVPYGMVIWSTGIGTRPVIAEFMQKIGQNDRRALATDEWLRVPKAPGVYALGDCATIQQRTMQEDMDYLFRLADVDHTGKLDFKEFQKILQRVRTRYPQIDIYLDRRKMRGLLGDFELAAASEGDEGEDKSLLDIQEFRKTLCEVDSQMKLLPATAQVAAQQGEYLAECFNKMASPEQMVPQGPVRVRGEGRHSFQPFMYRHLGSFAPLGGGEAGLDLPGDWVSIGKSTQWLWYSVYASKQVSWRTRALVVFDWTKRALFGRDSSRM